MSSPKKSYSMMIEEDNKYVIKGAFPMSVIPNVSLGKTLYENLLKNIRNTDVNKGRRPEAMIDAIGGGSLTYRHLLGKSCTLAAKLQSDGYAKGAIFALISPNSLDFFVPVFAAMYLGAIVAPINPQYTDYELEHCLEISRPSVVFCSAQVASSVQRLKHTIYIRKIIVLDANDAPNNTVTLASYIGTTLRYTFVPAALNAHTHTALIMCSSGTTGLPKGVELTHTNLMMRYYQTRDPALVNHDPNTVSLGLIPFYHAYGLVTNIFSLVSRQLIVFLMRFEPTVFLQTIQQFRIQQLWLAPPLVVFLAKHPLVSKYDLSSVKDVICGAAPLTESTEAALMRRLHPDAVLRQGYGLTECTFGVLLSTKAAYRTGSCGIIVDYMQCKVRDPDTGRSLPPGEVGELCFKGALVMKGYYGNPEATAQAFTLDGWLRTGDMGYYNDEKFFFIVDRLKELIKYKGYQVAPAELEGILLRHPEIRDVGVVGKPDEETGELPLAFVVKESGSNLKEKDVVDYIAGIVSAQKRLRGGVIFVEEIPKNPSGKILRRELRNKLKQHLMMVKSKL